LLIVRPAEFGQEQFQDGLPEGKTSLRESNRCVCWRVVTDVWRLESTRLTKRWSRVLGY